MQRRTVVSALVTIGANLVGTRGILAAAPEDALWQRLRSGRVALLMRHAQTEPGTGDPANFTLGDCSTQRNLDERGRRQARAWGDALRRERVPVEGVYTSAWCRCRETAELLDVGPVEGLPALNSFFEDRSARDERTAELRRFLSGWSGEGVIVLVSHQVNVTALTGVFPRSGEAVVLDLRDGRADVVGRLPPPTGNG